MKSSMANFDLLRSERHLLKTKHDDDEFMRVGAKARELYW